MASGLATSEIGNEQAVNFALAFDHRTIVGIATATILVFGSSACEASSEQPPLTTDAALDAVDSGQDAAAPIDGTAPFVCDVVPPTPCPDLPLRYTSSIEPIVKLRCVPCHDGRGPQWPLTTYSNVTDWYDQVQAMVANCTMPPADAGVQIPTSEREQILTWIGCGYPE